MISGLRRANFCDICGTKVYGPAKFCSKCRDDLNEIQLRAKRRRTAMGHIYAIGVARDPGSVVKIGYARSVEDRLKTLQIGSPVILEVIGIADGRIQHEQRLHRALLASRSHGEWFNRTDEVLHVVGLIKANQVLEWLASKGTRARAINHLREQNQVV